MEFRRCHIRNDHISRGNIRGIFKITEETLELRETALELAPPEPDDDSDDSKNDSDDSFDIDGLFLDL